jgi:hypothetical protein
VSKYSVGDDGKTIDGKMVVFLHPPGAAHGGERSGNDATPAPVAPAAGLTPAAKAAAGKNQAAALGAAAKSGVAFCEKCEQARRKLAAMRGEPA